MEHAKIIDFFKPKEIEVKKIDKEEYFTQVFDLYYKRIFNYTYYRVNSRTNAEDITSQIFQKSMAKIKTFDNDKAKFEIWLFAIARNTINDYFRKMKIRKLVPLDSIFNMADKAKGPEDIIISRDTNVRLVKALDILNKDERNIIAYKFGAELKNTEIAKIMGLSDSNVGVKLCRIMKKLKKELEKED
ncbi:MAG: sigma-70 family RNA polymerase sigma factor [Clostridium sp.]|nr:sigma-70 family RNA polymerase sigma factor [Clostridium sp.]